MLMLQLIIGLLLAGAVAWASERWHVNAPRWVSLSSLTLASLYLLGAVASIPAEQFSLVPSADQADTWLMHYQAQWIPRFGISLELAMDGLSLILVLLTLLLGMIAVTPVRIGPSPSMSCPWPLMRV